MARRQQEPPAVEYRSDPELARATAVATRSAIKAAVAEQLAVSTYSRIIWVQCKFPAIQSMLVLRCETGGGLGRLGAAERDNLLRDTTPRTALEEGTASFRRSNAPRVVVGFASLS